jgi:hypothetical protein
MVIFILLSLTFTASVDQTVVPVGESFNVSVMVEGENLSGVETPSAPNISGIDILGTSRSQSTRINFINGNLTKSTSYIYDYQMIAEKEGQYTISPFTLKYKGEEYSTDPITIDVKKRFSGGRSTPPSPTLPSRIHDFNTETRDFRAIFLETAVSKSSVYPGEPIVVKHYLYVKTSLTDVQLSGPPTYENVWVENIQSPTRLNFTSATKNGIRYQRALIKQDLLFPLGEKDVKINPFSVHVIIRGDMFSFFGERKTISSEPKTISVKSIPSNTPAGFIDAVGDLEISAEIDTSNIRVDSPFSLKIIIRGKGNLNLLSAPKFPETRKLTAYPPESSENTKISDGTLKGERVFTYLVTPKVSGIIEAPEIEWAYFDIQKKKFVSRKIGPWQIHAMPTDEIGSSEQETSKSNKDIAYILPVSEKNVSLIPKFFPLCFIPSIIFMILAVYYVIDIRKTLGDRRYASLKAIPKQLKRGFRKLEKEIFDNNIVQFYEDLTLVLLKFIKLKFHLNVFGIKKKDLLSQLLNKKVPEKSLELIEEILVKSESVRFTSLKPSQEEMSKDLKNLKEVINALH